MELYASSCRHTLDIRMGISRQLVWPFVLSDLQEKADGQWEWKRKKREEEEDEEEDQGNPV